MGIAMLTISRDNATQDYKNFRRLNIHKIQILFNHPHDIAGIIETNVLDVYNLPTVEIGSLVIDIGAGIGDFTILASKRVGAAGKVLSIEPIRKDFETLLANIRLNSLSNVIPVNAAIGSPDTLEDIRFKGRSVLIRTETMHAILKEYNIKPSDFKSIFIKMDVEGLEVKALRGMDDLILRSKAIGIELHGTKQAVDDILIPMGFMFKRFDFTCTIVNSLKFMVNSPIASISMALLLMLNREFPSPFKLLRGIEIAKSSDLVVGVYSRL